MRAIDLDHLYENMLPISAAVFVKTQKKGRTIRPYRLVPYTRDIELMVNILRAMGWRKEMRATIQVEKLCRKLKRLQSKLAKKRYRGRARDRKAFDKLRADLDQFMREPTNSLLPNRWELAYKLRMDFAYRAARMSYRS